MTDYAALYGLLVAALGGAGIGVERQWSGHASGDKARFAGIRTFTLLGLVAGSAGWLARSGHTPLAVLLLAVPAGLTVVAYARASRHDIDATTEVAACVTLAAGVLAGLGRGTEASSIIAVSVLLLVEKSRIHRLVARLATHEIRAAARFAVMAMVVLPLLPVGPFGPWASVRPRALWLLVLFFSGLSFGGYIARRLVGPRRGYPVTGALAGLVSSTNATFTLARLSREPGHGAAPLATGALAACTVLFPRVLVATLVLDPRVALALTPYVVAPIAVGLFPLAWRARGPVEAEPSGPPPGNPLQVWPALQMAATFQVVLLVVAGMRRTFGEGGLLATAAVLGLTDVDALTISMARSAGDGVAPHVAARAIATGILANCLMKAGLAAAFGSRAFAVRTAGALVGMAIALGAALLTGLQGWGW